MKKTILNLGKTLNKVEQKAVNGGLIILRIIGSRACEEEDGQSLSECQAICGDQGECMPCGHEIKMLEI